jgi:hypothetical protein
LLEARPRQEPVHKAQGGLNPLALVLCLPSLRFPPGRFYGVEGLQSLGPTVANQPRHLHRP